MPFWSKWNRLEWAMVVFLVAIVTLIIIPFAVPTIYAQTYGTLFGKRVNVIDATEGVLAVYDGTTDRLEVNWTVSSDLAEFYTGATTELQFVSSETVWMNLDNEGLSSVTPVFPNGFELQDNFNSTDTSAPAGTFNTYFTVQDIDGNYCLDIHTDDGSTLGLAIECDGTLEWANNVLPGAAPDVNLYRSAANVLKTDDTLEIDGMVDIGAVETFTDSDATPDVSTGSYFITNTSAVTITDFDGAGIRDGQVIVVESAGAITYDCTGAGFACGTTDLVTADGDLTVWFYNATDWILISFMDLSDDLS